MLFINYLSSDKKVIQDINKLNVSELKKNGQKTPPSVVSFFLSKRGQEWMEKNNDPKAISLLCNAELKEEEIETLALFFYNHPSIFTSKEQTPLQAIAMDWQDSRLAGKVIQKLKENRDSGISVSDQDDNGMTALHYAAMNGKAVIAKALLADEKEDVLFIPDRDSGRTPWHWAVLKPGNKVSVLFQSHQKGPTTREASQTDNFKKTVVDYAYQTQKNKLAISLGETRLASQESSLAEAIAEKNTEETEKLIAEGKDLHGIGKSGYTPLGEAVRKGDLELVKLLLKSGCNINQRMKGGIPPLVAAIELNNKEMVQLLLENGADPDMNSSWANRTSTPVSYAERLEHTEIAGLLKEYGAVKVDDSVASMAGIWSTYTDVGSSIHLSGSFNRVKGDAIFKKYAAGFVNSETCNKLPANTRTNLLHTISHSELIEDCDPQLLAQRIRDGETVLIDAGWKGHTTSLLFTTITDKNGEKKLYVAEGNRGDKAPVYGVTISLVRDTVRLETVLNTLKVQRKVKDNLVFHSTKIKADLELSTKYYLREKSQTVGNCWWANMGSGFRAALFFELVADGYTFSEAEEESQKLYGNYDRYGQQSSLEDYKKEGKNVEDLPVALKLKIRNEFPKEARL